MRSPGPEHTKLEFYTMSVAATSAERPNLQHSYFSQPGSLSVLPPSLTLEAINPKSTRGDLETYIKA